MTDRLEQLRLDIKEREEILFKLDKDHWLYEMQRQTLEDKKREYNFLKEQSYKINNEWGIENKLNGYKE